MKLYINQFEADSLRRLALEKGYTEEWFEKWLEDCVIIVRPLYEVQPKGRVLQAVHRAVRPRARSRWRLSRGDRVGRHRKD